MTSYTAKIKHSEDTIKAMAKAQYDTFKPKRHYFLMVFSIALLAVSLFVPSIPQGPKALIIMLGCFTIVGLGTPARQLAKQVIYNLNGNFPTMQYEFGEQCVHITGADVSVLEYRDILRIVQDNKYLYIFIQNRAAYMIDRSSARPDEMGLKKLVARKTGLVWTRPGAMPKLGSFNFERTKTRL